MNRLLVYGTGSRLHNVFSLDGGFLRLKYRRDRRPGLPIENPLAFYPKFAFETVRNIVLLMIARWRFLQFIKTIWGDPNRFNYVDAAIEPVGADDFETLGLYTATRGGQKAVASHLKLENIKRRAKAMVAAGT